MVFLVNFLHGFGVLPFVKFGVCSLYWITFGLFWVVWYFGLFGFHVISGLVRFPVSDLVRQATTRVGRADRLILTSGVIEW